MQQQLLLQPQQQRSGLAAAAVAAVAALCWLRQRNCRQWLGLWQQLRQFQQQQQLQMSCRDFRWVVEEDGCRLVGGGVDIAGSTRPAGLAIGAF